MSSRFAVLALLLSTFFDASAVALPFRTVALSGEPAPGTPPGVVFAGFEDGVINEDGTVVISAGLSGPGVTNVHPSNAYSIWRHSAGVMTKVVRSGEQAVGLPAGVNYYLPGPPRIDGQGRAVFLAEAPGVSTHGVFSEGQGTLRLVARETSQIDGQPAGVVLNGIGTVPLMNDVGSTAFTALIGGGGIPGNTEALFSDRSGPLQLIVREGNAAPGIPAANILQIGSPPVLNDLGVIAFEGRYTGGIFPNDTAIWTEHLGTFQLLARSGQAPAAMPAGVVFGRVEDPRINNAGQVAFFSTLTGPGITAVNDSALWLYESGGMQVIARKGSAAEGIAPGTNHGGVVRWYLNGTGETTFIGLLAGPNVTAQNDTAVWTQRGNSLALVAREGDPAPGTPAGIKFGDVTQVGNGLGFQVNNQGQVAFEAMLTGPGITTANDTGIWVTDLAGVLRLVAREGDLFDVSDDPSIQDFRTVASTDLQWYSGGGEDGFGSAFNNSGELVISLRFTDVSQGAFVISAAVPEPSTMLLLSVVFAWMSFRRNARR